jgi:hypothetical protein
MIDQKSTLGCCDYKSLLIGAVEKDEFVAAPEILLALSKRRLKLREYRHYP